MILSSPPNEPEFESPTLIQLEGRASLRPRDLVSDTPAPAARGTVGANRDALFQAIQSSAAFKTCMSLRNRGKVACLTTILRGSSFWTWNQRAFSERLRGICHEGRTCRTSFRSSWVFAECLLH